MKRFLYLTFAFLLLAACDEEDDVTQNTQEVIRPVRAVEIADMSRMHDRYFVGTAKAAREVSLAFRIPGTIQSINIQVGDVVTEGDVVARLDPAPYQAEVDRLAAELESAEASLVNAAAQTQRQRTLVERDVAAEAALDRYVASESSAEAAVKAVQGALDRATLDLTHTQLKAPFDGRIVAKYSEDFEETGAQTPVLRMLDANSIEMVIDIPERFISLVPYVEDIKVTFAALENVVLPAIVSEIGSEASLTTRTFPVTLLMQQPEDKKVLPGMAGRASGRPREGFEPFDSALVPATAIFVPEGDSDPHVWIYEPESGAVSARPVELGTPRSHGISISSGVEFGDIVVTAGANSLREGQKVSLLSEDED